MNVDREQRARLAAFRRLEELEAAFGETIPARALRQGFVFEEGWIPLTGTPGIWQPSQLEAPVSIRTAAHDPYRDELGPDGLSYAYIHPKNMDPGRAKDHAHNRGLREVMGTQLPLAYFHAVAKGEYQAFWPAWIVGDDRDAMRFEVAIAEHGVGAERDLLVMPEAGELRYANRLAKVRLHQRHFRHRVLTAYRTTCAVCRLKNHRELLDAAHIKRDAEGGAPLVSNGLSLCKIHHAAYDSNVVGIRPDYVVEVNRAVLEEVDGPMLRYGLQERHGDSIHKPRRRPDWPDAELLEERYEAFREAG